MQLTRIDQARTIEGHRNNPAKIPNRRKNAPMLF